MIREMGRARLDFWVVVVATVAVGLWVVVEMRQ